MRFLIITALFFFLPVNGISLSLQNDIFEIETEGIYQIETESSVEKAKKVALFIAQKKAVDVAGRYLSNKSLIKTYNLKKDEIYSLAAREIQVEIIEQNQETVGNMITYHVRTRANIQPSDFIKAEMKGMKLEQKETEESYKDEMEQPISPNIDPGLDIAHAYRLLREKKWRLAVIYLDHLEKKYPNWASIYMAKATAHYILNEPIFMQKAINDGCRLGNKTACDDLKNIKKLNEHDFGISSID